MNAKSPRLTSRHRQIIIAVSVVVVLGGLIFLFWSQKKAKEYDEAFRRGMTAWKERQAERAIEEWRKAAKVDPDDPELWVLIGRAELVAGHADRASESWEEALRREPGYKPALFERGKEALALHVTRRLRPPVDAKTGWLPLDLESPAAPDELQRITADLRAGAGHALEFTQFAKGAFHLLEGRHREAPPLLQVYTDLNPWDASAIAVLGIAGHYGGLSKGAEKALTAALALRHEKRWLKTRAETRYLQGNYEAARTDYRDADVEKDAEPLFARRIPFQGLILWLKADAGLDLTDASVSKWADQSGGRNDATVKERSPGPRVTASALHGHPAVLFSGENDDLRLPNGFEDFSAGVSVFVVGEPPAEPPGPWSFIDLATPAVGINSLKVQLGRRQESEKIVYSVEDVEVQRIPFVEGMAPAKGFEGICAIQDPSKTVRVFQRGQPLTSGTLLLPRKTVRTINRVGPGLKGHLAEILLYKRSLSELERLGVEAYLHDRYFSAGGAVPPLPEKR